MEDGTTPGRRAAVVTGVGTGGLGLPISAAFVGAGLDVVVANHPAQAEDLLTVTAQLDKGPGRVIGVSADISDEADVDALARTAVDAFGTVEVLVNNAGVMLRQDIFTTSKADWQRILDVNLTGTWLMCRAFGQIMCAQQRGTIINMSSIYAERVGPLPESAYYASKAGIANLSRGLAAEFGRSGVTVNCVAPGVFYPTNMTLPLGDQPEVLAEMTAKTMLGRLGDPDRDIHEVVLFLASSGARYITGQLIHVDGGWTAW
jgi:gluconate 5-dehydrogenase